MIDEFEENLTEANGDSGIEVTPTNSNPPPSWPDFFQSARTTLQTTVIARTFIRTMGTSFSSPVQLKCDDGHSYIVKSSSYGLATATEQIVARLAPVISSPVPETRLVSISQSLLDDNKLGMNKFQEGLAHGLRFMPNCTDKSGIEHQNLSINRQKFASLAVLYGWFHLGGDHQFFYDKTTNEVYSFDHGFFFPNGPNWSEMSLDSYKIVQLDPLITGACTFTQPEIAAAKLPLAIVTSEHVATAIMSPPDDWQITMPMRLKAAEYLMSRCQDLQN